MATTNYNIPLPVVGGSVDTWGSLTIDAFESFDGFLFTVSGVVDGKLDKSGGALTGALNGTTATFTGAVTATSFVGTLSGNASSATKWNVARTLTLTGAVTGSLAIDGSANGTLPTSIADGVLTVAKTNGLQTALDGKQATLNANQILPITYGTAAPIGTPADGAIYLQHET